MDSRERITALLNLEEADRVGFVDGPWRETVDRWEKEGLPQGVFINECFGMDIYGIGVDTSAKYDSITYEEGETWRLVRDSSGVKQRVWRNRSGVPASTLVVMDRLPFLRTPFTRSEKRIALVWNAVPAVLG